MSSTQRHVSVPAARRSHKAERPAARAAAPGRDRYLDLLRSVALFRVVFYHLFGWGWLSVVFPSMGVMFALAGSLMARSLSRPALGVVRGRLRRLLPPMWAFGAVMLTTMLYAGWRPSWTKLLMYVLPVGAPGYPDTLGDDGGLFDATWPDQAVGPLWYIRAYLWFVLLSPLLLKAFRRMPWPTLLAPLGLTALLSTGLVSVPGEPGLALTDFAVFGSCWMLGFAHQDGLLQRVPRYFLVSCAVPVMVFGLWWASGHLGPDGWDLNDIPLAQAAWSFGACAILLAYSPSWQQLPGRLAKFDKWITLSNNRAVTIYLWHNTLIMATVPLIDQLYNIPWLDDHFDAQLTSLSSVLMFVLVWPLIGLMILAVGWIEDVAAKRRPRLWPTGGGKKTLVDQAGSPGR
ncbi:acyltransferase family protein [Streptomyces sp. NBC_01465]|uniref:acyltransferase family protein n=1 Tax=Streptomyces sp. NBC_01465 TaxID=2903878 RepID=UPI002E335A1F|nr:acyltransferase [Streptomyces sp. NBC_01465]